MPAIVSPRRRFPWEVLLLIFEQATPSTLAILGQVSFDVLVTTSSLLYTKVELRTAKAVEALFCKREEVDNHRINPYLALTQIRTLSFDTSLHIVPSAFPHADFSRIAGSDVLPLENFFFSCRCRGGENLSSFIRSKLLPHLRPRRAYYDVQNRSWEGPSWLFVGNGEPRVIEGWECVEEVSFEGVIPHSGDKLAGLPSPTVDRPRTIRLHVQTLLDSVESPTPRSFVRQIVQSFWMFIAPVGAGKGGTITFVVGSEEGRLEAEEAIVEKNSLPRGRLYFELEVEL